MKKFFSIFYILVLLFSVKTPARAASEFATTFHSLYEITDLDRTHITHTITLKNNLSHIYATDYTIATSGDNLTSITAHDESGPLSTVTNVVGGVTTIHLAISHPAIGKDQTKTITLSYDTDGVVETIGPTIAVNIPRLAKANEAEEYLRTVKIKGTADLPSAISPSPSSTLPDGNYTIYTFSGHQNESLTLLFGESVTYRLNLTYELKNKELVGGFSELALPMDTPYQHILLDSIDPPPTDIRLDNNGNWLARYELKSQEKLTIKAILFATVYPKPTLFDPSPSAFQNTRNSLYWSPTSNSIQNLAEQLKTPENIYNYLVNNFTYNYEGINTQSARLGAITAITSPSSVLCTEFTDSFVSLARAQNIPAREINGYGYTKNESLQPIGTATDILHAWPEYYNAAQQTWISVDPTWGNTTGGIDFFNKLDFSHIAFVRHGDEDSYPLPAGAYKSNQNEKYVAVEIAEVVPPELTTSETRDNVIYNTGNVALINDTVGYLPPYGSFQLPDSSVNSFYDKIKSICAKLLSKFWQLLPAST